MLRAVLLALLLLLVARLAWRVLSVATSGFSVRVAGARPPARAARMVRDPVCGTFVLPERAVALVERGRAVHFCSTACRDEYRARPA